MQVHMAMEYKQTSVAMQLIISTDFKKYKPLNLKKLSKNLTTNLKRD